MRLRESQQEDLKLRLAQRDLQLEKMKMKSQRSVKKVPRRERFSLDQSESSLSVLQRPLVRRGRRTLQEKEMEAVSALEKETQELMAQQSFTLREKKVKARQKNSLISSRN